MTHFKNNIASLWNFVNESWRFAITAFIIARLFYGLWSWVIFTIEPVALQNFELSGEPILSIFKLENSEAHLYLRKVNGDILTFLPGDFQHIVDQKTGSVWDISRGEAIQGSYKGYKLSSARTPLSAIFPYFDTMPYQGTWLSMWQRFDANWYTSIAEHGYGYTAGDDHFPPMYPLLIRLLRSIFGNAFLAGLFISSIATIYALKLLYDVFLQWGQQTSVKDALLFFVMFPTFFFLLSAYSEPIYLVAALLACRTMKLRKWAWAGFWIFCAILTRLQGVALLIPMLYLMWQDRSSVRSIPSWFGLAVSGFGGLFYLYLRSQQSTNAVPLVEIEWRAQLVPPWKTYWYALQTILTGNPTFIDVLNWVVATLFIFLLIWGWKKIPVEYNLYTMFSLFIILVRIVEAQPLISMSRYALTLFPSFYVLSLAGNNPLLRRVIVYTSILLNLYLSAQFFVWGWVA